MMKKLNCSFLLLLVSLTCITCASFYIPISSSYLGNSGLDYAGWRDYAWQQPNPNGVCTHLATYETKFELDQIISGIQGDVVLNGGQSFSTYLAAQKDEHSNLFYWAVGSRRGKTFLRCKKLKEKKY